MRFYFDLNLGRLTAGAGYAARVSRVDFKRGDAQEIRLGFYRDGTQEILSGVPQLQFMLKETGKYDADPVVSASSWTLGTTEAMDYVANPDFNTTELDTLLNSGDADEDNDIEYVDLMLEISFSEDGGSSWASTETLVARVHNDVVKGVEGVPTGGVPTYPTAGSLINLTDNISVTQAVDLDAIETRVNALDAAVILQGTWDASAGTFPGGGTAQAGDSYIVSVGGTVDSVTFAVDDRIIAILDNASTATFAANWHKADYSDQVVSVNTQTGTVVLDADDIDDTATTNKFVTAPDVTNLGNLSGTNSGDEVSATDALEGIVELATQAEVDTGTDTTRVVTPDTLSNYSGFPSGTPEGTAVLSTGETVGKLLQADGDDTCSWVAAPSGTPEGTAIVSTGETAGKLLQADGDDTCSWVAAFDTPEGTAILSTGETGGTKYLREDGDGTCSWQTVAGGGLSNIVEDTTPELGGELDCGANSIGFTAQTLNSGATSNIDWGVGNVVNYTISDQIGPVTLTFTDPANPGVFVLKTIQSPGLDDITGWPTSVKWPGGTAPTTTQTSGAVDIIRFYFDGTNYYGTFEQAFS